MNESKKVCVIMPVYNGANTIMLALKSLMAQTYKNWVCVIVNDGSTDSTKAILDSLTDNRFKVIHLAKNGGRGAARQVCLENAEGDYLTYLDADDFYHPEKIQRQVKFMMSDDSVYLVGCGVLTFNEKYIPIARKGGNRRIKEFKDGDYLPVVPVTAMIKLNPALHYQYNSSLNAGEDIDYFSRYLDGKGLITTDEILYYYSEASATYKKFIQYSFHTIKQSFVLMKRKTIPGLSLLIRSITWFFGYLVLTPIFGVDFFIKHRGKDFPKKESILFNDILNKLQHE